MARRAEGTGRSFPVAAPHPPPRPPAGALFRVRTQQLASETGRCSAAFT